MKGVGTGFLSASVSLAAPSWASGVREAAATSGPLNFVVRPYLQAPEPTSMTVMWLTNRRDTSSWVEYGEGDALDRKAQSSRYGLVDADDPVQKISLADLKPGTRYAYRVASKAIDHFGAYEVKFGEIKTSEVHHFTTPAPDRKSVSFLVFNDIHQNLRLFRRLYEIGGPEPTDLIVMNGDVLNHIDDERQLIRSALEPFADTFAAETPYVYVRGNHDARGRFARHLHEYIASPGEPYHYAFDYGPVHFLVMDLGEDKSDDHKEYSGLVDFRPHREAQRAWLEQEIASKAFQQAPFRVLLTHIPLFGDGFTESQCKELWGNLLNQGGIDLHLAGHWHRYRVIPAGRDLLNCPIVVGGGCKPGGATVMRVTATPSQLKLVMTRDDGKVVGEQTLNARP